MTLPPNPTLTWALAFWCSALVSGATIAAVAAAIALSPAWALGVLAAAAAIGAAGVLEPAIIDRAYRRWNALAGAYERFVRAAITRVCFFVVLGASLRRSGRLALAPPAAGTSCWVARPAPGIETWECGQCGGGRRRRWLRQYAAWSWRSGNVWALFLLPFALLLLVLETEDSAVLPDRLYTLY